MPFVQNYNDDLRLAHVMADSVDDQTMSRFKAQDLRIETKPDLTPVTDADKAAEDAIRGQLSRARPRDAVLGEEFGSTGSGPRRWIIDPIDGTKNFVRGVPVWATLISLLDDGVPVVGVVSAPALNRRWWAAAGAGAFVSYDSGEPRRLAVSQVRALESASLSFSSLSGWRERGLREQFVSLTDEVWRVRAYGDFFSYCLLAEGALEVALEPEVSLWDLAALDVLVREAGGRFTNLEGAAGPHGGSAIATNGHLHDEVLARLR